VGLGSPCLCLEFAAGRCDGHVKSHVDDAEDRLAGILEGADVVVDVSNSPSFETDDDMALTHLRLRNSERDASQARSRTNSDDRLSLDALGRIERGNGVIEVRDIADVRAQASVPHSLDDLTQLGAVGHDNEVDR